MQTIALTQGKVAIVDDDDYLYLKQYKWQFIGGYATRATTKRIKPRKTILMHRVINNTPKGLSTDHINGDRLDNRKINLRSCNASSNAMNRGLPKNNTSGYKGVCRAKNYDGWYAQTMVNGKRIRLGYFRDKLEAAKKYDETVKALHGEFAILNIQENK